MQSLPRCYRRNKSRIWLGVRQSPASNDTNTEDDEATALEAITRRQPVKLQQAEKVLYLL
jgi:hypothetical protein